MPKKSFFFYLFFLRLLPAHSVSVRQFCSILAGNLFSVVFHLFSLWFDRDIYLFNVHCVDKNDKVYDGLEIYVEWMWVFCRLFTPKCMAFRAIKNGKKISFNDHRKSNGSFNYRQKGKLAMADWNATRKWHFKLKSVHHQQKRMVDLNFEHRLNKTSGWFSFYQV